MHCSFLRRAGTVLVLVAALACSSGNPATPPTTPPTTTVASGPTPPVGAAVFPLGYGTSKFISQTAIPAPLPHPDPTTPPRAPPRSPCATRGRSPPPPGRRAGTRSPWTFTVRTPNVSSRRGRGTPPPPVPTQRPCSTSG